MEVCDAPRQARFTHLTIPAHVAFRLTEHMEVAHVALLSERSLTPTEVALVQDAFVDALHEIEAIHLRFVEIAARLEEFDPYGVAEVVWRLQAVLGQSPDGTKAIERALVILDDISR